MGLPIHIHILFQWSYTAWLLLQGRAGLSWTVQTEVTTVDGSGNKLTVSLHLTNDQSFFGWFKKKPRKSTSFDLLESGWILVLRWSWAECMHSSAWPSGDGNASQIPIMLLQRTQCKCSPQILPQVFQRMQQGHNRLVRWRRCFSLCHTSAHTKPMDERHPTAVLGLDESYFKSILGTIVIPKFESLGYSLILPWLSHAGKDRSCASCSVSFCSPAVHVSCCIQAAAAFAAAYSPW